MTWPWVYRADIGFGAKPWLVVSNNHRNRALSDLLAVRITTTDRYANLPTWVQLQYKQLKRSTGYVSLDSKIDCMGAGPGKKP